MNEQETQRKVTVDKVKISMKESKLTVKSPNNCFTQL